MPPITEDLNGAPPTADEQAAANAAASAAFTSGFDYMDESVSPQGPTDPEPAAAPAPAPAAPAPKPPKEAAPPAPAAPPADQADPAPAAEAPAVDPFASLPKEVRELLAEVPRIRHELRSAQGRLEQLRRERAQAPAAPPPAPSAPESQAPQAREQIRGELPEVAAALDEADQLLDARIRAALAVSAPAPQPAAPAQTAPDADGLALAEVHPDWKQQVTGPDFNLWLTTQGTAYADKIRSTESAFEMSNALGKFKAHQGRVAAAQAAAQAERDALETSRNRRVRSSSLPTRGNPRPASNTPNEDPEAAFYAGFNGT